MSRLRILALPAAALAVIMIAASCAGDSSENAQPANPLVGEWVRINPPPSTADTLKLRADGSASGDGDGLESGMGRVARWKIGIEVMPDGFCWAETSQWQCQAYLIRGDTLSLANARESRFVRVRKQK